MKSCGIPFISKVRNKTYFWYYRAKLNKNRYEKSSSGKILILIWTKPFIP